MVTASAGASLATMEEYPNWLEMPHDLMANIIKRLRTIEVLESICKVCTTWRRICKDPTMWKVIHVREWLAASDTNYDFKMLTKQAVDLSCGELIDINMEGFGTDHLLDHIVLRSNKLKRLCLDNCRKITSTGLTRAAKKLPQLEKLHIFRISTDPEDIEVIGQSCPQLKSLRMCNMLRGRSFEEDDDNALAIANNMHELRHLDLFDIGMTNNGLQAILDGCPHLQSLDVFFCFNLNLDGILGKQCWERFKDFKGTFRHTEGFIF